MDTILTIVKLLGGLGLFIYGMKLMGDGLENAAGEGLKKILEKVTKNPLIGVIVGAVVTMVIQSSSATTVMVVGFVNAGLMNLAQAAGIIMGANVGTTVTAQLVAFKLDDIAPIFVFVGAMMVMFVKGKRRREIGNIILGFGILFVGMGTMSEAMKPLTSSPIFQDILTTVGSHWYLGLIAGALITAVLQSSSATTGILVALATAGALNINEALPIIMGCNIGTCITAMLATVGTNKTAHRAAMLHLIFNVVGTIIFLPIIVPGFLGRFVSYFSSDVNRQIANAHTIFNVINTIIMVPLIPVLCKIVEKLIPGEDDEKVGPKYIDDRLLETPVIAAGQVLKETIRMSNKSKLSLELAMDAFMKNDEKLAEKVYENEQIINNLEECITNYLVKLSKCELSDKEKNIVAATFHVVNDIERIGDHAENLADLTIQKINKKLRSILIPNIVQFVLLLVMLVVGTLVAIPAIQNVFDELGTKDTLPAITLWFADFLNKALQCWYIPVIIILAIVGGIIAYINTPKGKYNFDYFKYKMPIFGELIYALDFSRLMKAMLLNLRNGMRIQEAIEVSKNVVKNYVMLSIIETSINNILIGTSWIEPFEKAGLSKPMVTEMLKIGMQTDLTEMMEKLIEYMEIDIDNIMTKIMKALPQIVYAIVGVVLIFFVLVVLVPCIQVYMGNFLFSAYGVG